MSVNWVRFEDLEVRIVEAGTIAQDGQAFGPPGIIFSGDNTTAVEVDDIASCAQELRSLADQLEMLT